MHNYTTTIFNTVLEQRHVFYVVKLDADVKGTLGLECMYSPPLINILNSLPRDLALA